MGSIGARDLEWVWLGTGLEQILMLLCGGNTRMGNSWRSNLEGRAVSAITPCLVCTVMTRLHDEKYISSYQDTYCEVSFCHSRYDEHFLLGSISLELPMSDADNILHTLLREKEIAS
ncbi:unnamed protein product [Onchocerca flexuosa]|uniref:DUF4174 domain-containing protein n=1 Tax=Onchocerca flexuosa TaxID=387005 RepID=A0A183I122_9BILA|nr:unnamed protein product [Onchocerca flexuosa]